MKAFLTLLILGSSLTAFSSSSITLRACDKAIETQVVQSLHDNSETVITSGVVCRPKGAKCKALDIDEVVVLEAGEGIHINGNYYQCL